MYIYNNIPMTTVSVNFFNLGAMHEDSKNAGQFHFMEHLMTHGIRCILDKMQTNDVDLLGATSNEKVWIGMQGLTSKVKFLAEEFFEKFFSQKAVTREIFENERNIILNEYNMGYSNPIQRTVKNAFRKHFGYYHSIGSKVGIEKFSYEDYLGLMEEFSEPTLLNVGAEDINIPSIPSYSKGCNRARLQPMENSGFDLEPSPESPQKVMIWLLKDIITDSRKATAVNMTIQILSDGLNSPMVQEVREKQGLAYALGGSTMEVYDSIGYYITLTNQPDKARNIMESIMNNPEKWITPERFHIISENLNAKEERRNIFAYENADNILRKKMGLVDNNENIKSISYEDVINTAKEMTSDKFFLYQE